MDRGFGRAEREYAEPASTSHWHYLMQQRAREHEAAACSRPIELAAEFGKRQFTAFIFVIGIQLRLKATCRCAVYSVVLSLWRRNQPPEPAS